MRDNYWTWERRITRIKADRRTDKSVLERHADCFEQKAAEMGL